MDASQLLEASAMSLKSLVVAIMEHLSLSHAQIFAV
jgi:hypothetical protein